MSSALLKRLFSAIQAGRSTDIEQLCHRIVQEEKKRGHANVAHDLERILATKQRQVEQPSSEMGLSQLPLSKRDAAPLVQVIPHADLRHHMVLPDNVEQRFQTIEREFAAKSRLAAHGLKPTRRILFCGPPGCGKSLGAERLAWSTGLALHRVRFDTLLSSYFGETLTNLRRIFDEVERGPCALLLDECDTLARSRTERNDVGEVNRITNALLEFLENFKGEGLIIAATNLDTALDSALFRRFDEMIRIPLPASPEISRLLKSTLSAIPTQKGIDWHGLSCQLDGMSCSEVVQVAQNAAKRCIMEDSKTVTVSHLADAVHDYMARVHH